MKNKMSKFDQTVITEFNIRELSIMKNKMIKINKTIIIEVNIL